MLQFSNIFGTLRGWALMTRDRERGFSLLELTIFMVIVSLIATPFLNLYTVNKKKDQVAGTKKELFDIQYALQSYVEKNNRLPCPADPTIALTASGWGAETTCPVNPANAPPTGSGVKSVTAGSGDKVWIGSVPINALNLSSEYATDAWGGRYTYAVSRKLTIPNGWPATAVPDPPGSISVVNEKGVSISTSPNVARFVLLSHGINKAGSYTESGVMIRCTNGGRNLNPYSENANCDESDATFVISPAYGGTGAIQSDDFTIDDSTTDTTGTTGSDIDKVIACHAKRKFYMPKSTDPTKDADGCLFVRPK